MRISYSKGRELMSLVREQQRKVFNDHGLSEYPISYDRYNYKYNGSVIACELSATGNGYVWGKELSSDYKVDKRGWINIKDFSENQLNDLIVRAKTQDKFK